MFTQDVAPGIHLIEHAGVNCYLVQDGGRVLLVDAGLPAMWKMTMAALAQLGHNPGDIAAVVLTHGHFDHLGFAARLQRELSVPVIGHPGDAYIAAHPYRYQHERSRVSYPFRYPRSIPILTRMALAGALKVEGVTGLTALQEDLLRELPGAPVPVPSPGHTAGHCALHFPDRDALISGDALVTLDPYTGVTGPQIVSAAATADTHVALESLDALARTGAATVLPGHGMPFTDGVAAAADSARHARVT